MRLITNARHVVRIMGRWYRVFRLECGHTKVARSYATHSRMAGSFVKCGACAPAKFTE